MMFDHNVGLLLSGDVVELTPDHMLLVLGESCANCGEYRMAKQVAVGDRLAVRGNSSACVVGAKHITKTGGTFAPITRSGTLLVNNVVASCYVGDHYALKIFGHTLLCKVMQVMH